MTPTTKLRFVERAKEKWDEALGCTIVVLERVLQQWWEDPNTVDTDKRIPVGEWIDVPIEEVL